MSELSRLRWLCRRGMKELDVSLIAYLDNHYQHSSIDEKNSFKELLALQDPELFQLVLRSQNPDERFKPIIQQIRDSFIS